MICLGSNFGKKKKNRSLKFEQNKNRSNVVSSNMNTKKFRAIKWQAFSFPSLNVYKYCLIICSPGLYNCLRPLPHPLSCLFFLTSLSKLPNVTIFSSDLYQYFSDHSDNCSFLHPETGRGANFCFKVKWRSSFKNVYKIVQFFCKPFFIKSACNAILSKWKNGYC